MTPGNDLIVRVDAALPASIPAARGTAVLCLGACFHREQATRSLELLVGGRPHAPAAWRMPRLDLHEALPAELHHRYRSGFWAVIPLEPRSHTDVVEIRLAARLEDGSHAEAPFARIEVAEPRPPAPPAAAAPGLIAVCMATFEPDMGLFRAQVESLRAQSDERWVCVISDDASAAGRFEEMIEALDGDERFLVSRSDERLGYYRNFERALGMAPVDAELVALCDQDDRWYPEKLSTLRARLGPARLVYSDQRLVDRDGRVLRESLWAGRRNNHTNLASLLVANSITGSAALFRREVAELALPFPEVPALQFHDHWIGLVALAGGDVGYVDRPLYDYVQHGGAVVGQAVGGGGSGGASGDSRGWRAAYFYGYLPRLVLARALLVRCAGLLTGTKRRALRRFAAADTHPAALAWLAARPLRRLVGRGETLGTERELALGIVWRHLVRARAGRREQPEGSPYDASCPPLDTSALGQERLGRWRAGI